MRRISIKNPSVQNTYMTDLGSDYAVGATSGTVRNNNSFAPNDLAVIGKPSEELSELKKINSLTGVTGLNFPSSLNFQHNKGTPVYKTLWDYVEIEGRSSSAGTFAVLTQSPIQWDNSDDKTIYFHPAGNDNWEYRFRFYNSVTTTYSEYSPTLSGLGFTKFQMGYIIREARKIANDRNGTMVSTDELLRALTRAKNIIRARNPQYWFWKVDGYQNNKSIIATSDTRVFSLASFTELGTINYIEFLYVNGATRRKYNLRKISDAEFIFLSRDLTTPANDSPTVYRLLPPDENSDKGYIEIPDPILTDGVGTFYVSYYKEEPDYDGVNDTTSIIMPEILEDYLIAEIAATKGNETLADKYRQHFTGPDNRERTLALEKLEGIALLDALDAQYKKAQGQPGQLIRFRGQKAMSDFYGSRSRQYSDQRRIDYFRDEQ